MLLGFQSVSQAALGALKSYFNMTLCFFSHSCVNTLDIDSCYYVLCVMMCAFI